MSLRAAGISKILVRCPNWVGDIVMATPALRALRESFPSADITVAVRAGAAKILEGSRLCNDIFETNSRGGDLRAYMAEARRLKDRGFDLAVILPNSFGSALVPFLARIPRRVGYDLNGRGLLLTDKLSPPRVNRHLTPIPMVYRYLMICNHLGCQVASTRYELAVSERVRQKVEELFRRHNIDQSKMNVLFIPGASFGSSKCWKPEYFGHVGDRLSELYDCNILIVPGPGEEEIARRVQQHMQHRPVNFLSEIQPLDMLMGLVEKAAVVVTNDTGPRHFAVALDKPVVVLMGPTDPRYTNANLEKTLILREKVECSPCHLKVCPTDHGCMDGITPERVLKACEQAINQLVKPHTSGRA